MHAERSKIATFGRYNTYAWRRQALPARSTGEADPALLDWRIRKAVDDRLAARGYARTEGEATLLADYDVKTRAADPESYREYFRYRREGGTRDLGQAALQGYEEGSLVFQMVDARTGELAYWASATAVIGEGGDRDRLEKAIARMLADMPRAGGGR